MKKAVSSISFMDGSKDPHSEGFFIVDFESLSFIDFIATASFSESVERKRNF
jgi:hypothetical protein